MSELSFDSALVTGGAGFIGSNLANELVERGVGRVIALDNFDLGTPENLRESVELHRGSVLDHWLPTDVDVVFHLAALSSMPMHEEDPAHGSRVNVEGFANVAEQARQDGCDTIVYASTSSIYGTQTDPAPESMSVEANTGYEASKLARERYAEYFSNHYGISTAGLRFFSVYQGYAGNEEHKGQFANIVSQFAAKMADGERPAVYGDGTQTRDFTHVEDVVRAVIASAEQELDGVYNVGTGTKYSFNDVVNLLNEELGTDIRPEYVENPIDDSVYVHDTIADTTRLQDATGWQPRIEFVPEGIRRVCAPFVDSQQSAETDPSEKTEVES